MKKKLWRKSYTEICLIHTYYAVLVFQGKYFNQTRAHMFQLSETVGFLAIAQKLTDMYIYVRLKTEISLRGRNFLTSWLLNQRSQPSRPRLLDLMTPEPEVATSEAETSWPHDSWTKGCRKLCFDSFSFLTYPNLFKQNFSQIGDVVVQCYSWHGFTHHKKLINLYFWS